jgi:phage terminase large subunit
MRVDVAEKAAFLFEPAPLKTIYGGRASAKSWSAARALLATGIQRPLRVLCAREIQRSLRESVHQLLADQIRALNMGAYYQVMDNEIRSALHQDAKFLYSGLQAHTAASIKSYESVDVCWIEEGQTVPKRSIDILLPTIRKPGSEIWVTLNPELATDPAYVAFVSNPPPGARVVEMNYTDNPWLSAESEAARAHAQLTMDPEDYSNIWLGKPRTSVTGAILGRQMAMLRKLGRIGRVAIKPHLAVNTFWDLGSSTGNATAIWLHQRFGAADHFVGYKSETGQGMRHFWDWLEAHRKRHGYRWGVHHLPHDGRANLQGAELINRVEVLEDLAREAGQEIEVVTVRRPTDLSAAVDRLRERITDAYFDTDECADGITALDHYRYEWIEALGAYSRQPYHDEHSNGADALRQWATGYEPAGPRDLERRSDWPNDWPVERPSAYVRGGY